MSNHKIRIKKLEDIESPEQRLEFREVTHVRKADEDEDGAEEIEVVYQQITVLDRNETPIARILIPKNGRDPKPN